MTNIEILQKQITDLQARLDQVTYERNEWRKIAEPSGAERGRTELEDKIVFAATALGLTRSESRVLQSLWSSPVRTFEQLGSDIYGAADLADRSNSIKVWMVKLRHKMGGTSAIDTVWGIGYRLSDTGRTLVEKSAARLAA